MKRIRKMMPLAGIAQAIALQPSRGPVKQLGVSLRVRQALGPSISAHVTQVTLTGNRLILCVPDRAWRTQLEGDRAMILACIKTAFTRVEKITFSES